MNQPLFFRLVLLLSIFGLAAMPVAAENRLSRTAWLGITLCGEGQVDLRSIHNVIVVDMDETGRGLSIVLEAAIEQRSSFSPEPRPVASEAKSVLGENSNGQLQSILVAQGRLCREKEYRAKTSSQWPGTLEENERKVYPGPWESRDDCDDEDSEPPTA